MASFSVYSSMRNIECLIRRLWGCGLLRLVRSSGRSSVCMYGQFVEDLLRDCQALDAQCFEVDLAVENALAQVVAPSSLDDVHDEGSDADGDE